MPRFQDERLKTITLQEPYRTVTVTAVPLIKEAIASGEVFRADAFELAGAENDIDHTTTKPKHLWTNGQVERMNRP